MMQQSTSSHSPCQNKVIWQSPASPNAPILMPYLTSLSGAFSSGEFSSVRIQQHNSCFFIKKINSPLRSLPPQQYPPPLFILTSTTGGWSMCVIKDDGNTDNNDNNMLRQLWWRWQLGSCAAAATTAIAQWHGSGCSSNSVGAAGQQRNGSGSCSAVAVVAVLRQQRQLGCSGSLAVAAWRRQLGSGSLAAAGWQRSVGGSNLAGGGVAAWQQWRGDWQQKLGSGKRSGSVVAVAAVLRR